jgi:hypothetical protein
MQAADKPPVLQTEQPSSVRQWTLRQRRLSALGAIAAVVLLSLLAAALFTHFQPGTPVHQATPTPQATATPVGYLGHTFHAANGLYTLEYPSTYPVADDGTDSAADYAQGYGAFCWIATLCPDTNGVLLDGQITAAETGKATGSFMEIMVGTYLYSKEDLHNYLLGVMVNPHIPTSACTAAIVIQQQAAVTVGANTWTTVLNVRIAGSLANTCRFGYPGNQTLFALTHDGTTIIAVESVQDANDTRYSTSYPLAPMLASLTFLK